MTNRLREIDERPLYTMYALYAAFLFWSSIYVLVLTITISFLTDIGNVMNSLLVSSLDIDDVITSVKKLDTRKIYMVNHRSRYG